MAAMSRKQLKELIKECIVEIFSEKFSGTATTKESVQPQTFASPPSQRKPENVAADALKERMVSMAKNSVTDPILRSIFEETAHRSAHEETKEVGVPLDAFASDDRFAKIAFADVKRKVDVSHIIHENKFEEPTVGFDPFSMTNRRK